MNLECYCLPACTSTEYSWDIEQFHVNSTDGKHLNKRLSEPLQRKRVFTNVIVKHEYFFIWSEVVANSILKNV